MTSEEFIVRKMVESEYELKRRANIERNNKYLQEIGLGTQFEIRSRENLPKGKKRKMKEISTPFPMRRSLRVASLPSVDYKEVTE